MEQQDFEDLVSSALEDLPAEIQGMIQNADVVVAPYATPQQLQRGRIHSPAGLLGLNINAIKIVFIINKLCAFNCNT